MLAAHVRRNLFRRLRAFLHCTACSTHTLSWQAATAVLPLCGRHDDGQQASSDIARLTVPLPSCPRPSSKTRQRRNLRTVRKGPENHPFVTNSGKKQIGVIIKIQSCAFHLPTRGLRVGSRGCFSISWVGSRLPRQKREKRVRGSGARVGSSPPM